MYIIYFRTVGGWFWAPFHFENCMIYLYMKTKGEITIHPFVYVILK